MRRAGFSLKLSALEAQRAKAQALKAECYRLAIVEGTVVPVNETEWMIRAVVRENDNGSVACTLEV